MIKEYQVTYIDKEGRYKPVSTIVKYEQEEDRDLSKNLVHCAEIRKLGKIKICQKRYWKPSKMAEYGYNACMIRAYNKAEIEKKNAERYAKIKEEKYASGEWKRPKKSVDKQ